MALPPGRLLDDPHRRHAKPLVTDPSHKPTSGCDILACENSDESPLSRIQINSNYLMALFPEKDKNDPSNHSRSCYLPKEWKRKKKKRYKQEKRTNPHSNHPLRANRSVPAKILLAKPPKKTSQTSSTVITATLPANGIKSTPGERIERRKDRSKKRGNLQRIQ